jgi:hypothetical protein
MSFANNLFNVLRILIQLLSQKWNSEVIYTEYVLKFCFIVFLVFIAAFLIFLLFFFWLENNVKDELTIHAKNVFSSVYLLIGRDIIQKFCEKKFIPLIDIHSYLSALYDSLNSSEWMYEFCSNTWTYFHWISIKMFSTNKSFRFHSKRNYHQKR